MNASLCFTNIGREGTSDAAAIVARFFLKSKRRTNFFCAAKYGKIETAQGCSWNPSPLFL
ncbi:hypothetical protein [Blastopirellula marina]|uniref:hypothetical protein n=1 Tax=Blastopirellula marina TaxID=124 RepID=UPI00031EEA99|nr:hypothetical protein [Blastopirellula marina]